MSKNKNIFIITNYILFYEDSNNCSKALIHLHLQLGIPLNAVQKFQISALIIMGQIWLARIKLVHDAAHLSALLRTGPHFGSWLPKGQLSRGHLTSLCCCFSSHQWPQWQRLAGGQFRLLFQYSLSLDTIQSAMRKVILIFFF